VSRKKKQPKSRPVVTEPVPRLRDPRVLAILAAFDRACGSPAHHSDGDTSDPGLIICCLDRVLSIENSDWLCYGWTIPEMRRLLIAYCEIAPDTTIAKSAREAAGFVEWIADFEDDPTGIIRGYSVVTGEKRPREEARAA
jgi:hypothetical protein